MTSTVAPAAPQFVVDTRREGTTELVQVCGEVDLATVPLLRAVLDTVVLRRPARVEIDLSATTFMDAYALSTLAAARRRLTARHATLVLRDPSPIVLRLLELTRMTLPFEILTRPAEVRRAG